MGQTLDEGPREHSFMDELAFSFIHHTQPFRSGDNIPLTKPLILNLFSRTGRVSGHAIKRFLISPSTSRVVRGLPAALNIDKINSKDSSSLSLCSLKSTTRIQHCLHRATNQFFAKQFGRSCCDAYTKKSNNNFSHTATVEEDG